MRDEQVGQAEVALQLRQQVDDLRADADVERGDRFVANDELWPERKGAGDADALALSAGELVGIAGAGGFVEADGAQGVPHTRTIAQAARLGQRRLRLGTT